MPTLEWANREAAVRAATRAPFRLLEHAPALSFGDPDNDPLGPWASTDFSAQGWRPNQMYKIKTPGGVE